MNQADHLIPQSTQENTDMQNPSLSPAQEQGLANAKAVRGESAFARVATTVAAPNADANPVVDMFGLGNLEPEVAGEQTPVVQRTKNRVRVYACGGTGVNLARRLESLLQRLQVEVVADLDIVYLDTSDANYENGAPPTNHYAIGDGKGSGKDMRVNIEATRAAADDIFEKHPPTAVNIFMGGFSGGSGPAIISVLFGRAQRAGFKNIAVGVVSSASLKEITNTLTFTEAMERTAASTGIASLMVPFHNQKLGSEEKANQAVLSTVLMLGTLFSGLNARIDENDIANMLDYRTVSKAPAKLMAIITDGEDGAYLRANDHLIVVTSAMLSKDADVKPLEFKTDSEAAGFYPATAVNTPTVRFLVVDGHVQKLYDDLAADKKRLQAAGTARTFTKPVGNISKASDDAQDDMILD